MKFFLALTSVILVAFISTQEFDDFMWLKPYYILHCELDNDESWFDLFYAAQVDDKYQYSCENKDLQVHGWICMHPSVGFWQITPSDEFRSGGPFKQNLSSHVGPTCLSVSNFVPVNSELWLLEEETCHKLIGSNSMSYSCANL